jgi:hypothetical protein
MVGAWGVPQLPAEWPAYGKRGFLGTFSIPDFLRASVSLW